MQKMSLELDQQEALLDDNSPSPRPPTPILPDGDGIQGEGDSSSSGSAPAADPVSAQLINNITMLDYHSLGKTTTLIGDVEQIANADGIGMDNGNKKLPQFVSWNWPLIRKILFWGVLSVLFACVAAIIGMVAALPRTCNPVLPWYQGQLFYEIFPSSFHDSNNDGIGDIKGLSRRVDYIQSLGVKAVRLNSIFKANQYPEDFRNVTSLTEIDKHLGTARDLSTLARVFHLKNISLVLDLPVYPYVKNLEPVFMNKTVKINGTDQVVSTKNSVHKDCPITVAIKYWTDNGVDGFYLKGIEHLTDDIHFSDSIREWKRIIGTERILMVNYETVLKAEQSVLNSIMNNVDLVDVFLDVGKTNYDIKKQVDSVLNGVLWSKPGYPWVHWSIGNVDSKRLSSKLTPNNTLAMTMMSMMLPGTPSIFYGDEVSLRELSEPEEDFHESKTIHNLTPMIWADDTVKFSSGDHLPWITGSTHETTYSSFNNIEVIRALANARTRASPIYLNGVWKDGVIFTNTQLRYSSSILVVERWYPRKNSYVFVSNLGDEMLVNDLSSWFYGGTLVVGTDVSLQGKEVMFKALKLMPAEAMVIKLEK